MPRIHTTNLMAYNGQLKTNCDLNQQKSHDCLHWSGWYCYPTQHARVMPAVAWPLAAALAGTTSAVLDSSTNHDSTDHISGQFLFYRDKHFIKSKDNFCVRRLLLLFVSIGICVTTHDDGSASHVTIGMWRHNQQATNHERNDEPWFSLLK